MIVAAIAVLCVALGTLVLGAFVRGASLAFVWMAVGLAPLSLVLLWIGVRRMRPPRDAHHRR